MRIIDADSLMDDIKRDSKKAIDEGDKVGSFWLGYAAGLVIKQPTIQPENAQLSQEGTTSDLIDRQAALDIFDDYNVSVENGELEAYSRDRKRMCELPPAQPEPQEGHWINGKCNLCGEHAPFWCMASTYHESNYCPNCGAKMKGERQK